MCRSTVKGVEARTFLWPEGEKDWIFVTEFTRKGHHAPHHVIEGPAVMGVPPTTSYVDLASLEAFHNSSIATYTEKGGI